MTTLLATLILAPAPTLVADVPFEHEAGRIWVKATLNGKPVNTALDTGATWTVLDEAVALGAGATKGTTVDINANGPAKVAGWPVAGLSLALEGTSIVQPVSVVVPMAAAAINEGYAHPVEALLGGDFLHRYVVEIDYAHTRLRLYEPKGYRPPKGYAALGIRFVGDRPAVEGTLETMISKRRKFWALIDTGSGYGLDLTYAFVRAEKMEGRIVNGVSEAPVGLGGVAKSQVVPWVTGSLGKLPFMGGARMMLTAEGLSGENPGYDAILGDGFLSRLDLVLDYSRAKLYLRSSAVE